VRVWCARPNDPHLKPSAPTPTHQHPPRARPPPRSKGPRGTEAKSGTIEFEYESIFFSTWHACSAHFSDGSNPAGTCMRIANSLKNNPTASAQPLAPSRGCRPGISTSQKLGVPPLTAEIPAARPGFVGVVAKFAPQGIDMWAGDRSHVGWWTSALDGDNQIDANFDCAAKFAKHWCASGLFGLRAVVQVCDKKFLDKPPFSCSRSVPKYKTQEIISLAWANVGLLWSTLLAILILVLRRLPGANKGGGGGGGGGDGGDGSAMTAVAGAKTKHVV